MEEEILYRSLKDEATTSEMKRVDAWRRASPEAEHRYQQLARLLDLVDTAQVSTASRPIPSAASLMARRGSAGHAVPPRVAWRSWASRGIAAAALVVLGFYLAGFRTTPVASEGAPDGEPYQAEFVTGTGELATARLKDGTVVRLAPRTRLMVTRWGSEREVRLSGRAFFAVVHMEDRPFRVTTDAGQAVVLGTRFELEASEEALRLAVVEGRVSLSAGAGPGAGAAVEVSAGAVARVVDGKATTVIRIQDLDGMLKWTGKFLAFQSTPLREAITDIERAYQVDVELLDDALANETITAWFVDRSLDEVLRIVCLALDANCSVQGKAVRIGR